MQSVFLSYARADDEAFVARAWALLRAHGFTVWWDRQNMPARSLAFTEEIRDAIHACDRVLVVIGPHALRSDYVRAEWQAALSERKPVVTALRRVPDGTADPHACLPPELKVFHAEPFLVIDGEEPALDPLVRLLSDPIPAPPPIFGRPPERPPHFRPRPDEFSAVFDAVLGETTRALVRTHASRVTVLSGMGGIGKTVLAASLVEAMRSRPTTFLADGIYWLTGDPMRRLAALCHAGVADAQDESALTEEVARLLDGKRFLLVVDNAIAIEQIAPLVRVLGPGGRMLVTTRHGELAVGHQHLQVGRLSVDDALQLVADWLGSTIDALPRAAHRVIQLCGFHPFAITLNAAAASQGLAWSSILTALERHELDYAEQHFEEYVYATVEQSLATSLDALPKQDRARYRELAAFHWDGVVPAAAITRFWHWRGRLAEHRAQRLLVFLQQRSLLQLVGPPERQDVRVHDLHLAHISRSEKKVVALGGALLDSHEPASAGAWWTVHDDGYLRRELVRHLLRSRSAAEALALMAADDGEGRNAWYGARVHGAGDDGYAGYVADLDRVSACVAHCLLVLIAASLRSLARAVPAALLGAAVVDSRRSVERAVAQARLIAEPEKRARSMAALLSHAQDREGWLEETLAAIGQAEITSRRALMAALAPALEEAELLPVLRRVVGWARQARTPYEKNWSTPLVWPVLDRLPAALAAEAMVIVAALSIRPLRLYGLLAEPARSARVREALAERRARDDDVSVAVHASTVATLAIHLDPETAAEMIAEAFAKVRRLEGGPLRQSGSLSLLPCLPVAEQRRVIDELIADARDDPHRLVDLARKAPPALHAAIRVAVEDRHLVWLTAAVAPLLAGDDRARLVDLALAAIETSSNAASLLWMDDAELVLAMNDQQLDRARAVIDAQLQGKARVDALIACVRAGSAGHRERRLGDALGAIDALRDAEERERAFESVASLLAPAQLAAALASAERIGEPSGLEHLAKMLPHLSPAERGRATELLARHARRSGIVGLEAALRALPAGADIGQAEPLVALALELDVRHGRAHLLGALARRVAASARERVVAHARAAITQCEHERSRIQLLLEVGDVDAAEQELEAAAGALAADSLASAGAHVAQRLPARRAAALVHDVLRRAAGGEHVLETLAPHLAAPAALSYLARSIRPADAAHHLLLHQAMERGLPHASDNDHASTAAALARRLGELGRADGAFALLRVGADDDVTTMGLVALAPWLSREHVLEVERRAAAAKLRGVLVPLPSGGRQSVGPDYLGARLAPALARAAELDRALGYAAASSESWRIDAYLGVAAATTGSARSLTLRQTMDVLLQQRAVYRSGQIDDVARAVALDPQAAHAAWAAALVWARGRPRDEAIEVLASLSPVSAAVGGAALVDEVFRAIERVVRWWP